MAFCKLLTRVDAFAALGFGFDGTIARPGAEIDTDTLPRPIVVLECAGRAGPGRGQPMLYILWRLEADVTWRAVARATAHDWTWALTLRTIAIRELRAAPEAPPADLSGIAARVLRELDKELQELPRELRAHLLGGLEIELDARIAAVR